MATINLHDEIYATLTQRGIIVAKVKMQGIKSLSDVLMHLRSLASNCVGLVTLKVRNYTQGWSQSRSIKLTLQMPMQCDVIQLSLF